MEEGPILQIDGHLNTFDNSYRNADYQLCYELIAELKVLDQGGDIHVEDIVTKIPLDEHYIVSNPVDKVEENDKSENSFTSDEETEDDDAVVEALTMFRGSFAMRDYIACRAHLSTLKGICDKKSGQADAQLDSPPVDAFAASINTLMETYERIENSKMAVMKEVHEMRMETMKQVHETKMEMIRNMFK